MIERLGKIIRTKFSRQDDLSRQLEIVKVFDLYKEEIKKFFPKDSGVIPLSLKNKILRVEAQNSVQASELRFHETEILQTINEKFGREILIKIIYRM